MAFTTGSLDKGPAVMEDLSDHVEILDIQDELDPSPGSSLLKKGICHPYTNRAKHATDSGTGGPSPRSSAPGASAPSRPPLDLGMLLTPDGGTRPVMGNLSDDVEILDTDSQDELDPSPGSSLLKEGCRNPICRPYTNQARNATASKTDGPSPRPSVSGARAPSRSPLELGMLNADGGTRPVTENLSNDVEILDTDSQDKLDPSPGSSLLKESICRPYTNRAKKATDSGTGGPSPRSSAPGASAPSRPPLDLGMLNPNGGTTPAVMGNLSNDVEILDAYNCDEIDPSPGSSLLKEGCRKPNTLPCRNQDKHATARWTGGPSPRSSAPVTSAPTRRRLIILEDDASKIVEAVRPIGSPDEDSLATEEKRPIMLLLRRLIGNKQHTIMTNAQIIDILENEFAIRVKSSHELEVNIYMKIVKRYLKDWPEWEELERMSTKLMIIKDFDALSKVLDHKYKNLKEYLSVMLEAAKPLVKEAMKNIPTRDPKIKENIDSSDVVMEIKCTKEQLNHLFFRRPRVELNNTIFNVSNIEPSGILQKAFTFEEILTAGWVRIYIYLPNFMYVREMMYVLSHVLVNKARNDNTNKDISLNTNLQMKASKKSKSYTKNDIVRQFNSILKECRAKSVELHSLMNSIFDILKRQLNDTNVYKIPGNYKKFANKYKYVRYLYVENEDSNDTRYDLQLEETVSPAYQFYIGKIGKLQKPMPPLEKWFKIECMACHEKINGSLSLKESLLAHYNDHHRNEPEWQCLHCKQSFSLDCLSKKYWRHEC